MGKSRRLALGILYFGSTIVLARPAVPTLLITRANVFDPIASRLLENQDVLVVGGRFSEVGPSGQISAPPNAHRLDLAGLALLPGLIDLHSHLLLHPYNEASSEVQVLKESLELRAVVAAERTLDGGFTSLRDLGTTEGESDIVTAPPTKRVGATDSRSGRIANPKTAFEAK